MEPTPDGFTWSIAFSPYFATYARSSWLDQPARAIGVRATIAYAPVNPITAPLTTTGAASGKKKITMPTPTAVTPISATLPQSTPPSDGAEH